MNDAAKIAALESTVATLQANMTSLKSTLGSAIIAAVADTTELKGSVDTFYLLYSGALVFFMQARIDRHAVQPHPARISLTPNKLTLKSASASHHLLSGGVRRARGRLGPSQEHAQHPAQEPARRVRPPLHALPTLNSELHPSPHTRAHLRSPPSLDVACAQVRRRVHLVCVGLRHGVPHRRRRRQPVHRAARQGPRRRRLGARRRVNERRRLRQLVVPM
jgi:hypothetical protein